MPLFSDRLYTSQNSDLKREARMGDDEARERARRRLEERKARMRGEPAEIRTACMTRASR